MGLLSRWRPKRKKSKKSARKRMLQWLSDPLFVVASIMLLLLLGLSTVVYLVLVVEPDDGVDFRIHILDISGRVMRVFGYLAAALIGMSGLTTWRVKRHAELGDKVRSAFRPLVFELSLTVQQIRGDLETACVPHAEMDTVVIGNQIQYDSVRVLNECDRAMLEKIDTVSEFMKTSIGDYPIQVLHEIRILVNRLEMEVRLEFPRFRKNYCAVVLDSARQQPYKLDGKTRVPNMPFTVSCNKRQLLKSVERMYGILNSMNKHIHQVDLFLLQYDPED